MLETTRLILEGMAGDSVQTGASVPTEVILAMDKGFDYLIVGSNI